MQSSSSPSRPSPARRPPDAIVEVNVYDEGTLTQPRQNAGLITLPAAASAFQTPAFLRHNGTSTAMASMFMRLAILAP